ncbi:hypothetical protein DTL42_19210 [Bremerella cremea]|uniref:Uncharacterized protein n=1 Tax=Bremerella cremea TaxID=1031537 RepID=A0A368KPG1_9BACT|nr:hypothetical protein [Bremerella cremea]RCS43202.1 hypothetical protein DTL42_19210 [Bremerella cremea]
MTLILYRKTALQNGKFSAIVCDGRLASEIDDQEFVTYYGIDGAAYEIRQKGISEVASASGGGAVEKIACASVVRLAENSTDFELRTLIGAMDTRFLCEKTPFNERQQACRVKMELADIREFRTFTCAINGLRTFEDMLHGLDVKSSSRSASPLFVRYSDEVIAAARNVTIWAVLHLPICFRCYDTLIYGIITLKGPSDSSVIISWVDGPERIASGTQLFCTIAPHLPQVVASVC